MRFHCLNLMKSAVSAKRTSQLNWRLRAISCLLAMSQEFAVWPVQVSMAAASEGTASSIATPQSTAAATSDATSGLRPNRALPPISQRLAMHFSNSPTDDELGAVHVFREPLIPVGGKTSPSENIALATIIRDFAARNDPESTVGLTSFLNQFPGSPWRASLFANLGALWRATGHWSKALDAWEEAWPLVAKATEPRQRALADYVLGELAQLNARLGRADRLEALFAEIGNRDVRGAATERVATARQGLALMRTRPQDAFRCGPMALKQILVASHLGGSDRQREILTSASTEQGMSLVQVKQLADKLGLKYQMAKRSLGAKVIVPAVINWRVGHYAALIQEKDEKFRAQDPTFGDDTLLTQQTIDEEQSGYFLVPAGDLPSGWQPVSEAEGKNVWGKGNAGSNPEPPPPCVAPSVKCSNDDCTNPGMADYNVDSARVSLTITDTPVSYTPPVGSAVKFTASYQQREVAPVQTPTYSNLGNKWSFNWLSYIIIDPANEAADATVYGPGGGTLHYNGFNSGTRSYAPQRETQVSLVKLGVDQYEKRFPDGSRQIFAFSDAAPVARKLFMTQSIDPHGNALAYSYDGTFRLVAVTDAIGQVTTLSYELTADPLKVTKVTDPFGRVATLEYNEAGQLWKITDSIGLISEFTYDTGDFINKMTTPYGDTLFAMGESGSSYRWLEITDPQGAKERVEYNNNVSAIPSSEPGNTVPPEIATYNQFINYRNTFYWDKKAMAEAPGVYTKARITHWLHTEDINVASDVPESSKMPFENRVWNNYPGQTWPAGTGNVTIFKPSKIARVVDDGTTQLYQYRIQQLRQNNQDDRPARSGYQLPLRRQRNRLARRLSTESGRSQSRPGRAARRSARCLYLQRSARAPHRDGCFGPDHDLRLLSKWPDSHDYKRKKRGHDLRLRHQWLSAKHRGANCRRCHVILLRWIWAAAHGNRFGRLRGHDRLRRDWR